MASLGNVALARLGILAYQNRDSLGELRRGSDRTPVRRRPNQRIERQQVEAAIDPETISELSAQTGLSKDELLKRIVHDVPDAVDKLTPTGNCPARTRMSNHQDRRC